MTDKEIIKALKVCAKNETPFCCGECELGKNNSSCDCVDRLLKLSLDLINRQQAENKELKKEKYRLQKALNQAEDCLDIAKAEIENLQKELASKGLKYSLLEREKAKDISGFVDDLKLARAEAVKEFAERLKADINKTWYYELENDTHNARALKRVDELVKEMVGEQE